MATGKSSPTPDEDPRQTEATLDKLEAEARTAEATARKTLADARTSEATARKTRAEAEAAEVTAADTASVLGQQRRDAIAQKDTAVANKEAAAARRDQLAALIPDFGKVKDSTLDVGKDGPPMGGTGLTYGALADAAERIAEDVQTTLGLKALPKTSSTGDDAAANGEGAREAWVLVTSELDLANPDGVYHEVVSGLDQLSTAANKVYEATDPDRITPKATAVDEVESFFVVEGTAVVGALAGALPHVLSLLSSERAVRTASVTVTDVAATAAVAGALRARTPRIHVFHDDFRLIHQGRTYKALQDLSERRQLLIARKILLTDKKSDADAKLPAAKHEEERLAKVADGSKKPADLANLKKAQAVVEQLTRQSSTAAIRMSVIDSMVSSIDAFTAAIRITPAGGRRTPLATAALHELLRPPNEQSSTTSANLSHVLLVKGQAGTAVEMTDDKPLWFQDRFSSVVDVSVTYMLVQTSDSQVVDADTVTATATAHGKIGEKPTIDVELPAGPPGLGGGNVYRTPRRDPGGY